MITLDEIYREIISEACRRGVNESFSYQHSNISPQIKVNEKLLEISYINIPRKARWILNNYYLSRKAKTKCIDEIKEKSSCHLSVSFRAVKVFPIFYADLIALSEYCEMKNYKLVDIKIKVAWTKFLAPYVYEAAKTLKIQDYSKRFILDTIDLLEEYRGILHLDRKFLGMILRAATAYYSTICKCYSMREARLKYYYIRANIRLERYFLKYLPENYQYSCKDLKCVDNFTLSKISELKRYL